MADIEHELAELWEQIEAVDRGEAGPETLEIMGSRGVTLFMKLTLRKFQFFEATINRLAERVDQLESGKE